VRLSIDSCEGLNRSLFDYLLATGSRSIRPYPYAPIWIWTLVVPARGASLVGALVRAVLVLGAVLPGALALGTLALAAQFRRILSPAALAYAALSTEIRPFPTLETLRCLLDSVWIAVVLCGISESGSVPRFTVLPKKAI
jgi:hypothetical protein